MAKEYICGKHRATAIRKATDAVMLMLIILIGVSGCMKKQSTADRMVAYMNDRYADDVFTYTEPFGGGTGSKSKEILVSSEKFPDSDIWVQYSVDKDGNELFQDSYLGYKYGQQASALLEATLAEIVGDDFYYEFDASFKIGSNTLPGDATFEEFLGEQMGLGFVAVIGSAYRLDRDIFTENLKNAFAEKNICSSGVIYFEGDQEDYIKLKEGELNYTWYVNWHGTYGEISQTPNISFLIRDGEYEYSRWR